MLACAALFLSDLHLGSNQCEARSLRHFLRQIQPEVLYLVGDVIDLPAIRCNASVDDAFLNAALESIVGGRGDDWLRSGLIAGRRLLRPSHLQVLRELRRLLATGVRVIYIPGNHDARLRRYAGLESGHFSIRLEDVYLTPDGRRLLVRHGDEFDRLIRFHADVAGRLIQVQERYSGWIGRLSSLLPPWPPGPPPGIVDPDRILARAEELLARHWQWPVPTAGELDGAGFSLAFALESALKERLGHDRVLKRMVMQHLVRENRAGRRLDGVINGHTHVPEASALAWPPGGAAGGAAEPPGPCHITYYNDGSWARSQRRVGRTALVVAANGTVSMIRFDRKRGIVPLKPPRFPFNTYPMRPCAGCGQMVADPASP